MAHLQNRKNKKTKQQPQKEKKKENEGKGEEGEKLGLETIQTGFSNFSEHRSKCFDEKEVEILDDCLFSGVKRRSGVFETMCVCVCALIFPFCLRSHYFFF